MHDLKTLLFFLLCAVPVVHVSRGERKSQDRTELENRAKAPSAVPTNNAIHKTRDIISASTQTLGVRFRFFVL